MKESIIVTLLYRTPHMVDPDHGGRPFCSIRAGSVPEVWEFFDREMRRVMEDNPHIKRYEISEFKMYITRDEGVEL